MSHIDELLQQMTLEEKISMLAGADLWHSVAVPRLGIPQFKVTDGPNGARGAWGNMGPSSVATPVGIALGATWNPDLVEKVGNVLGDELKAKGAHILLAPTVNIHRTPIAGRNFECYSEDPFLSGMLASAYIKGIQDKGVGACIKHFVANDQEYERFSMSSEVDERTLREIYLEPFRIAIRNSNPWAVMSAYNRVNGTYACENDHTLLEILKGEWKFEGIVMSDWFGTYDQDVPSWWAGSRNARPRTLDGEEFVKSARRRSADAGRCSITKCNGCLECWKKPGLFANPELQPERAEDKPQHRRIIREAAREAIVLLKNDNGILPSRKSNPLQSSVHMRELHRSLAAAALGSRRIMQFPHSKGSGTAPARKSKWKLRPAALSTKIFPLPLLKPYPPPTDARGLSLSLFNGTELSGEPVYTEVTTRVAIRLVREHCSQCGPGSLLPAHGRILHATGKRTRTSCTVCRRLGQTVHR